MARPTTTIKERIREGLDLRNMKAIDLSNKTGIPKSSISQYLNGYVEPKSDRVFLIAKALDVSEAWLLGFDVPIKGFEEINLFEQFNNITPISKQSLPMLGEIACGEPIFCNEEKESFIEATEKIKADFCLIAKGDSMINARIKDGDVVFIKSQPVVENGEIAAVVIDDSATLKRVYVSDDAITLVAENPAYPPIVISNNEINNCRILGKAVAFQSNL